MRRILPFLFTIFLCNHVIAQNLLVNGLFNQGVPPWVANCPTCTVEDYDYANSYGGTSTTQHVAEVDDESTFYQDICVLPGASYVYSQVASRRTGNGTPPSPEISNIIIEGLNLANNVVATYVDFNYSRTNTIFAFTPVTGIPVITVPASSGVVRLRVLLSDSTPGAYSTLGMVIDSLSLVFQTLPSITGSNSIAGADSACIGSPQDFSILNLSDTGNYFTWNFGAGSTPPTSTLPNPTASWSTSGTKTISCILSNGACNIDTVSFNVYIKPASFYSYNDTTCYNVPYVFGGVPLNASGTYVDSFTTTGGCDSIVTLNLFVRPQPTVTATNNSPFCINGTNVLDLFVNTSPGATYSWTGPGGFSSNQQNPVVTAPTPANGGVYSVAVTLPTGCTASGSTVVSILPGPPPPLTYDITYCQYDAAVPLNAIGSDMLWYTTLPGTGDTVTPIPSTQTPGTYTWYVTQTAPNGCISTPASVNVKVNFKAKFTIAADSSVCLDRNTSFRYDGTTPPPTAVYAWSAPRTTTITGSANTSSLSVTFDSIGTHTIFLSVSDDSSGLCTATDSLNIYVAPPPVASFTLPTDACIGQPVNVVTTYGTPDIANDGYVWTFNGANVVSGSAPGPGPYSVSYQSMGTYQVSLTAVSRYGCPAPTITDTINIHPTPQASIDSISATSVCTGDSIILLTDSANYDKENSYVWSPKGLFIIHGNTTTRVMAKITASTEITLTVTTPFGCADSTSTAITGKSCCGVYFPTAFTPCPCTGTNNSQPAKDRLFHPITIGHHNIEVFRIVNRWGQVVYSSSNEEQGWDGTLNGVPQDTGDYFWYIKYQCSDGSMVEDKGVVTLLR